MEKNEMRVQEVLVELLIDYEIINHPPVFNCDEMISYMKGIGGAHCKNLFLRNKKGNRHILVILVESKNKQLYDSIIFHIETVKIKKTLN
ncbi:hypothetical protein [Acetobacterium bakii]|uniref:hypothetical protein n=1 Tax=Acetobacterium bakii TaxID=52689 RepID=UPI00068293EC|nr:hypothetical protein [Acetobacterium bakii]